MRAIRKAGVETPHSEYVSAPPSLAAPILGSLLICTQCETIARTFTDEQFTTRISGKASIGEHLRHCLEHFTLLLEGLRTGSIDYDARKRNTQWEKCRTSCMDAICNISRELQSFTPESMCRPLFVRMLFAPHTEPVEVASTLARELGFVASHAIHHIAIIKMLAQSLGASLPEEYGVGHATMMHRQNIPKARPCAQ